MNKVSKTSVFEFLTRVRSSKLARALSGSMLVAIASRLSSLGMAILLARHLSPAGYGAFVYAIGIATIVAQASSLGWPILMSRFIPKYIVLSEWGLLRGLVKKGEVVLLVSSILASCVLLYCGKIGVFDTQVSHGLALAAVLVPALTFLTLRKSQLAAQKKSAQGLFFNEFLPPTAIVILSLYYEVSDLSTIFFVFAGFNYFAVLLATLVTYKTWPVEFYENTPVSDFRNWILISLPLLAAVSSKMIMSKADILMLVPLSDIQQAGYYGAVFRVTYLLTFSQVVLMTVMSPLISEAITKNNFELLHRRFLIMIGAAGLFSTPLAIFVLIFRTQIIEVLFGAEYLAAVGCLVYLVFSQTAVTVSMPLTSLMVMAGKERIYGSITLVALILNLSLNWFLIPTKGAQGAAIATLISCVFSTFCSVLVCRAIMQNYRSNTDDQIS